jgi:hypothetical protein
MSRVVVLVILIIVMIATVCWCTALSAIRDGDSCAAYKLSGCLDVVQWLFSLYFDHLFKLITHA